MKKFKGHSDGVSVRGFFRIQITEDGKGVVGDSGWRENKVMNDGLKEFIVSWLVYGAAASTATPSGKYVRYMQLGTGSAPASDATTLNGEITGTSSGGAGSKRMGVTASIVASGTAQFTAQFASVNSFVTKTEVISNVGLFNTNTIGASDLFAGNTYIASSCATNQSVNATYQIRFASA